MCQQTYSHGRFAHFQPSVENPKMEWNADWIDAVSTKVALLLTRLRTYGFFHKLPVDEMWWSKYVKRRVERSTPQMLHSTGSSAAAAVAASRMGAQGKCIVFSNFIEAIDSVANSLSEALRETGIFMRFTANMKGGTQERIAALKIFRDDPKISILLLDGVGAVGLDLSFVSHIFLLDPIWDKSLEDQVISRAHRLGAKRSITVEKFIARGTVEQMMERLAREPDGDGGSAGDSGLTGAREEVHEGQAGAHEDAGEGSARSDGAGSGSSSGGGVNRRQRGDEMKKIRETNKVRTILTGVKALDYDPDAEREREEIADSLATPHSCSAARSAYAAPIPRAPSSGGEQVANAQTGDFVAAAAFQGSKPGYVFKNGQNGLGYYMDCPPASAISRAGASGGAAHCEDPEARAPKRVRFHE
jgi:hypothetical protein